MLLLLVLLVIVGGAAGYYVYHKSQTSHSATAPAKKQSVTLYYDDGKTILWQNTNPSVDKGSDPQKAPYFTNAVRAQLLKNLGATYYQRGEWKIVTNLNAAAQAAAEKQVAANALNVKKQGGDTQAVVVEKPNGAIVALVGGTDYNDATFGKLNYATDVKMQPGTSILPLVYASLLDQSTNYGAGTKVSDVQKPLPGYYPCTNATSATLSNCLMDDDRQYPGDMSLRYALGGLRNVPAIDATSTLGVQKVIDRINTMGADYNCYQVGGYLKTKATCYQAALLGEGAYLTLADEANAYAVLANGGNGRSSSFVKFVTLNGKEQQYYPDVLNQPLRHDTAYIINDIMSDPNPSRLPASDKFQHDNGWKFGLSDGVTNGGFELSAVSWSTQYVVATMVTEHTETHSLAGFPETVTLPVVRSLMETLHAGKHPVDWMKPSDVQTLPAFVTQVHVGGGSVEPSPSTDLYPKWYKP